MKILLVTWMLLLFGVNLNAHYIPSAENTEPSATPQTDHDVKEAFKAKSYIFDQMRQRDEPAIKQMFPRDSIRRKRETELPDIPEPPQLPEDSVNDAYTPPKTYGMNLNPEGGFVWNTLNNPGIYFELAQSPNENPIERQNEERPPPHEIKNPPPTVQIIPESSDSGSSEDIYVNNDEASAQSARLRTENNGPQQDTIVPNNFEVKNEEFNIEIPMNPELVNNKPAANENEQPPQYQSEPVLNDNPKSYDMTQEESNPVPGILGFENPAESVERLGSDENPDLVNSDQESGVDKAPAEPEDNKKIPAAPVLPPLNYDSLPDYIREAISSTEKAEHEQTDNPYVNPHLDPEDKKEINDKMEEIFATVQPVEDIPRTYGMNLTSGGGHVWNDLVNPPVSYDIESQHSNQEEISKETTTNAPRTSEPEIQTGSEPIKPIVPVESATTEPTPSVAPEIPFEPKAPTEPAAPVEPEPDKPIPPLAPVAPFEPTPPIVSEGPLEPTPPIVSEGPLEPTPPIVSEGPLEPTPPFVSEGPVEPTPPIVSEGPLEPTGPIGTVEPVAPVEPEPDKPIQPVEPNAPFEPTPPIVSEGPLEPTAPIGTVEPVAPVETKPDEPIQPLEPVAPFEPTPPIVSEGPLEPTAPIETVEPGAPVKTKPDEPIQPLEPVAPFKPTPPIVSERPLKPTPPIVSEGPLEPTPPIVSEGPLEPTPPIVSEGPLEPTPPIVYEGPLEPTPPIVSEGPLEPTAPIETVEPGAPVETKPDEPIQPLEPVAPFEPTPPIVSEGPLEPIAPIETVEPVAPLQPKPDESNQPLGAFGPIVPTPIENPEGSVESTPIVNPGPVESSVPIAPTIPLEPKPEEPVQPLEPIGPIESTSPEPELPDESVPVTIQPDEAEHPEANVPAGSEGNTPKLDKPSEETEDHLEEEVHTHPEQPEDDAMKPDIMNELLKSEQFWNWLGQWTATYMELLEKHIRKIAIQEICNHDKPGSDICLPFEENGPLIRDGKLFIDGKEIAITHTDNLDFLRRRGDSSGSKVDATTIYGNSVGNEKVTNVFIFNPDQTKEILEEVKPENGTVNFIIDDRIKEEIKEPSAGTEHKEIVNLKPETTVTEEKGVINDKTKELDEVKPIADIKETVDADKPVSSEEDFLE